MSWNFIWMCGQENSTRQYNSSTVYDWFNDPFPDDCGSQYLNISTITIGDRPQLDKISRYIPYLLPDSIYVASKKSIINFTTNYDSPQLFLLTFDDTKPLHSMKRYEPYCGRVKIRYCSRKLDEKIL